MNYKLIKVWKKSKREKKLINSTQKKVRKRREEERSNKLKNKIKNKRKNNK